MLYKRKVVDYVLSQIGKIIKFMLNIILHNIVKKTMCNNDDDDEGNKSTLKLLILSWYL